MTITTKKAENAANAVEILGELNFRNVNFVYHGETNEHGAPVVYRHFDGINADGDGTCFGLIEIVINGKLDTVRFINSYRETAVDIKIGNAKYTLGDKGEVNLIDETATVKADEIAETVDNVTFTDETEIARFEVGKRYRGKLDCGTKKLDCTIEVIKRTAKCIVYPTGGNTNPFCTKIKCSDTSEYISPASGLFVKASDVVIEPQSPTDDKPKAAEAAKVKDETESSMVIEVKTFDSGRFTVKLNGKKIALNVLEQPPYYDSADLDTVIIFNNRKFRNVGRNNHGNAHYYNVFADENGYGFCVTVGGLGGDIWELGKGMTPIRDVKNEIAQIEAKHKAYIDRQNAIKADEPETVTAETDEVKADEISDDSDIDTDLDSKLAELFQAREVKRIAARNSSFDSEESKALRDANRDVEEFIGKVAKDLRDEAPEGLSVVDSWDSSDLDAPKFVVIELATDKRTSYSKIAQVKAALKTVGNEAAAVNEVTKFEVGKRYCGKAYKLEKRWGKYRRSEPFSTTILVTKRTNSFVYAALAGNENYPAAYKIRTDATSEYIDYGHGHYFKAADEADEGNTVTKTVTVTDGYDESAFDLLPTVNELNDTRSDIEKEFDEFAVTDTDRDARFNHGERHAAKLEKKLRKFDPTVEVTYDINEDDEDVFYLRFGKYVYGASFATLDAVEETFHLWREDDEAATSEQVTADMLSKRDEIIKQRNNLDVIKRNGIITEAEYADKAAELDSELRYVGVQIDAVKAGDTFDYVEAAEHIKSVYEDLQLCVDLWTRIHGLTVEQCEQVYVAAHVDRNFTDEADRELASRMIDHFKQGNELTAKLREVTSEADYKDVTCQDGATILAHFKGAKVTVDGGGYDILTAWDRLLGRYDTAAQVTAVINRIKVCVDDGKIGSFAFPTVDELNDVDDLTDAEPEGCTDKLRKAMTANGNRACVEPEDCVIATFGEGGIDNDTVDNIVDEMTDSGCWVEYPEDDELTPEEPASEFDKAVTESVKNYSATIEINGETLTFEDGQLSEVGSTRYGAYFTIRNGRRIFYYRGNRVSKQDFFAHIETEDKAISERAAIAKFVAKYGGSEFKPGTNPQGNFVAQIHPTLANGRQDNYEVTFDTKDEAHAFIDEFKILAGDMKFLATIKRGSFYGEVIYRHGLNGQEYFTTETKESLREKKYALWDERRAIDGEIIGVKNAISEIKDGMRWLSDAGNCDAQIDELDYIIVKLEYRLGILSDKRNAIGAKIDDCNEKARIG